MERIKSLLASIYEGIGTLTVLLSVWLDPPLHMEKEVHSLMNNVQALSLMHTYPTHSHSLTHSFTQNKNENDDLSVPEQT